MLKFLRKIFDRKLTHIVETDIKDHAAIVEVLAFDDITCNILNYKRIEHKVSLMLIYSRNRYKDLCKGLARRGKTLWNTKFIEAENTIQEI